MRSDRRCVVTFEVAVLRLVNMVVRLTVLLNEVHRGIGAAYELLRILAVLGVNSDTDTCLDVEGGINRL